MPIVQLRPPEESFDEIIFGKLVKLDAIILCEGKTEVETVKQIIEKLSIEIPITIGLADCKGITRVPRETWAIAALVKVARKLKNIGVLVDAENQNYIDRAKSIIDSLRAKEFKVEDLKPVKNSQQVFETIICTDRKPITLTIAVSGITQYSFKKHTIENHTVKLMLLEGKIEKNTISKHEAAEEIVGREKTLEIIKQANRENIKKAYNHIIQILKQLTT